MSDVRPIGVMDSGVGGISVLKELYAVMPHENYIYFGDSKNAPYGSKTPEEVKSLVKKNVEYLVAKNIKALVVACNTATSVAVEELRAKYTMPIIGVEPALKPAVLYKENPTVAVMATPITLSEFKFKQLTEHYSDRAKIIPVACHKLATYVERGILSGEELEGYIASLFKDTKKPDAVVLGCTHYPFVIGVVKKVLGPDVKIFDGGEGTARETRRRLEEINALKDDGVAGKIVFLNSLESKKEQAFCEMLFREEIK